MPQGARITSARLEFTAAAPGALPTLLDIRAEASDNATAYSGADFDLTSRPTTGAAVTWDVEPWVYTGATGARQRTPDLSGILQEIVDRPGWELGNIALLLVSGTGSRLAQAAQGAGSRPARLVVEFE